MHSHIRSLTFIHSHLFFLRSYSVCQCVIISNTLHVFVSRAQSDSNLTFPRDGFRWPSNGIVEPNFNLSFRHLLALCCFYLPCRYVFQCQETKPTSRSSFCLINPQRKTFAPEECGCLDFQSKLPPGPHCTHCRLKQFLQEVVGRECRNSQFLII